MSRFFVLMLALLLPFQFAWAAAASYCQHETDARAARHLGHHVHVHQADGHQAAAGNTLVADADCATCHAVGASLIGSGIPPLPRCDRPSAIATMAADPLASAPARAPDRPQWLRLA